MIAEPRWKKVVAWIALIWSVLVFANMLLGHPEPGPTQAYVNGQYTAVLITAIYIVGCFSQHYLFYAKAIAGARTRFLQRCLIRQYSFASTV